MNIIAQCCGIVIMFVMMYFYFKQKRLQLHTARAFLWVWNITLIGLIMDIASMEIIFFSGSVPKVLILFVCKLYLVVLVCEALSVLHYVCVDIFLGKRQLIQWNRIIADYGIVAAVFIAVFPILYVDQKNFYIYGSAVVFTYVATAAILVLILFMVVLYPQDMDARRKNGVVIWTIIWISAACFQFIYKEVLIVSFASVVGALVLYLKLENPEINIDGDTGLFNLNAFFQYVHQLECLKKNVSVLCVDYDNSRNVSISFEIEQAITEQIVQFMEGIEGAVVFRSSSNEFLLVFSDQEKAVEASVKIEERFDSTWGEENLRMISEDWFLIETTEMVKSCGDILPIFQYVQQNRSNIGMKYGIHITNDMIQSMYEEREMETAIIEALNENRVEVFYQPIYSVKDKVFASAEALVRIRDRRGRIIPPGKFIGVAEKKGLIIRLGERVFDHVCKFIVSENPEKYGLQYIEVNLSVVQCGFEHLADDFIAIMDKYQVDPKYIVLEITESASIQHKNILLENMKKLRDIGVKFALDDFGTGQSNLNYIVEMPVDVVKFDSSMTNAYFENGTAKYVMDAAMQMIQGMDLEIVSEGIEKKNQYTQMEKLGIDYIQGFYFSKPVETSAFLEFLREHKDTVLQAEK